MAISAVRKLAPINYTPESEEGGDQPSTFKLGQLNGEQYLEVMAASSIDEDGQPKLSGAAMKLALRHGVIGWSGVYDADDKPLKFSYNNLKTLPVELLMELVAEVFTRSSVDGEELKNS